MSEVVFSAMLRPKDRNYNIHGKKREEHIEVFLKDVSYCVKCSGMLALLINSKY